MPIEWAQLKTTLKPERFTVATTGKPPAVDPWRDYWTCRQKISKASFDAVQRLAR
jgi:DNA primase